MTYLYWLGFGTLIAVLAVGIWQLFAVGQAKRRNEHSSITQPEHLAASSRTASADRDRTSQP